HVSCRTAARISSCLSHSVGVLQRFQLEEHLIIHRHKHEMTLKFPSIKADTTFTDQTPTPTRFLQNCEEVGLFKEIEEEFLQAQEEEKSKQTHPLQHPQSHGTMMGPSCSLAAQQALSSSQSGSVITQAPSTLTHSGAIRLLLYSTTIILIIIHSFQLRPSPTSSGATLRLRSIWEAPTATSFTSRRMHRTLRLTSHRLPICTRAPLLRLPCLFQHSYHQLHNRCSPHSSPTPSMQWVAAAVGEEEEEEEVAAVAGGQQSTDPDERRQKFLERNRAAATRCRQKRKLWVSSLEKKAEELTHTNLQLQLSLCPAAGVSPGGSPTPVGPGSQLQAIQHNSISTSSTSGGDTGHDPQPGR
ncbi:Cyclic AMP-responsive element-binding protein 5, partial [Nibea albiflora]